MDRFVKLVSASWSSKLSEMERSSYELGKKKRKKAGRSNRFLPLCRIELQTIDRTFFG